MCNIFIYATLNHWNLHRGISRDLRNGYFPHDMQCRCALTASRGPAGWAGVVRHHNCQGGHWIRVNLIAICSL